MYHTTSTNLTPSFTLMFVKRFRLIMIDIYLQQVNTAVIVSLQTQPTCIGVAARRRRPLPGRMLPSVAVYRRGAGAPNDKTAMATAATVAAAALAALVLRPGGSELGCGPHGGPWQPQSGPTQKKRGCDTSWQESRRGRGRIA